LFDSIKRAGDTDGDRIRLALSQTKNYPGITGNITIDDQRNARKPIVMIQIVDGQMKFKETIQP
jgi:branched-chain amino acid transport system substrate-binding protein